jgi:hypothetical protein
MAKTLTAPLSIFLLLVVLAPANPLNGQPLGDDSRLDEAIELVVEVAASDDEETRIKMLRKLAAYRYSDVALALVQLTEEEQLAVTVLRELEWVLVAMGDLALRPLADALAGQRVATDFATVVWKRIARQDPALLLPYVSSSVPAVARAAALAISACNHPDAPKTAATAFSGASAAAQTALLEGICLAHASGCPLLLESARKSTESQVRSTALAVASTKPEWLTKETIGGALQDSDINVVRSALTVLEERSSKGYETDLAILLKLNYEDVQERALRSLARAGTRQAAKVLAEVAKTYSESSRLGRIARELVRQGAGEVVVLGDAVDSLPTDASLSTLDDRRLALRLYNHEGFRVIVRGALYVKCKGMPQSRTNVRTTDFSADGTLSIQVQCQKGGPPEVRWKRRDGQQLRARISEF